MYTDGSSTILSTRASTINSTAINYLTLPSYSLYNTSANIHSLIVNQSGGSAGFYSNGSLIAQCNIISTIRDEGNRLMIGTRGDSNTSFFGNFYEILIYNTVLTSNQRQFVESYLGAKWGVSVANSVPALSINLSSIFPIYLTGLPVFTGLALWLDGADPYGTGMTPQNGTVLSNWVDKSGNRYDGVATGSPTWSNGIILIPSTNYYTTNYLSTAASAESSFIVFSSTADSGAGARFFLLTDNIRSTARELYMYDKTLNLQKPYVPTVSTPVISSLSSNTQTLAECIISPSLTTLYVNGNNSVQYTGAAVGYAQTVTRIGFNEGGYGPFTVSEVIIFSNVLSTAQRQAVEGYLLSKWNISVPSLSNATPSLWLDGADPYGNGVTPSNGTVISTWIDKSGKGYNANVSTGSPTYSNGAGIVFNGSTHYTSPYTMKPNETGFFVMNFTGITEHQIFFAGNAATNTRALQTFPGQGISIIGGGQYIYGNPPTGMNVLIGYTYTSSATSIGINGIQSNFAGLSPTTDTATTIGALYDAGYRKYLIGTISEIIIYNTVLSSNQRQSVENYLSAKWGILPARPSLQLWLDGADPYGNGTAPANGTVITTWTDKSGNGRNGAGNGTYSNGIVFNGSLSQYYSIPYAGTHSSETGFIVVNINNASSYQFLIASAATNARSFYFYPGQGLNLGLYGINVIQPNNNFPPSGVTLLLEYSYTSGSQYTYQNGQILLSNTAPGTAPIDVTLTIGAVLSSGTPIQFFTGTISEILIYNTVLSSNQRQAVEGYLHNKWAITPGTTNPFSNTSLLPTPVLPTIQVAQPNVNLGYLMSPSSGNPGTSTLYYDGTNWSLN